ncbi:MAG: hypothetical protein M3R63_25865 [Actinomycetota bacterium]|nr:hypothetical protein [Actinomycetota bacterium]
MHGDPDYVEELAHSLRRAAERAADQGRVIRDVARGVDWTGAAADAFRSCMAGRAAACDTARDDLVAAARACEQHADEVRDALRWVEVLV